MSVIMRLRGAATRDTALLGFAVEDVPTQGWIVAAQFEPVRIVLAILCCRVGMRALGAAQFDNDPVAFFARHGLSLPLGSSVIV